jgi:eukaryotic-like serine/threonine-protein kinase
MENTHLDPAQQAPRSPDPPADLRAIGGYRLLRLLGEGGMGAVYLGWKEDDDAQVAVKVLSDQLAGSQDYIDRFYREAKSGKLLNHPNIVRTLSYGQDEKTGKHYLVLEFVDGPNALDLLKRAGRLPVGDAIHIALDVARALEHAHSRNVIHRDIKPDNILITKAGVAKLADLGLAKRTDETSHLTSMRQGFGTSHYMPYEQAFNARSADNRSDIYALGATLYHLATGSTPFSGEQHMDIVEAKKEGYFPLASALIPDVPAALDAILNRMLARLPVDRYQTASALIVDLERSGLSASLPTFADPELAKNDPWMQACLASSSERTRLDPNQPPHKEETTPTEAADVWMLRFRNRAGRLCKARATTGQIIERLRDRRLPHRVVARRPSQPKYRPLAVFPEFQAALHARRDRKPKAAAVSTIIPAAGGALPRRRWPISAVVATLIVLGAALGVLIRFLIAR